MDTKRQKRSGYHIVTPQLFDLLELLFRYKYLRTSFIRELLECGDKGIIHQLKLRRDQGYIFKPKEQLRGYNNLYSPRIHSITRKGEDLLRQHDRHPLKATRLHRKRGDAPVRQFAHAMMICDATASIEIGVKKTGCEFIPWTAILERCEVDDPMRLAFSATYEGKPLRGKLVPDGLFGIRYPNGQASFFALECEHFNPIEPSDLKRASTLKKLLAYHDIIERKTYQQLTIPNLRVLFTYPTATRAQHAKELAERLYGTTNMFLFHDIPVQEMIYKAPPPFPKLVTSQWLRAGLPSVPLYEERDDATKD